MINNLGALREADFPPQDAAFILWNMPLLIGWGSPVQALVPCDCRWMSALPHAAG